jgi:hypothetical protein
MNAAIEHRLQTEFPAINVPEEDAYVPMVITDCDGNILLWFLPSILSPIQQVSPQWH